MPKVSSGAATRGADTEGGKRFAVGRCGEVIRARKQQRSSEVDVSSKVPGGIGGNSREGCAYWLENCVVERPKAIGVPSRFRPNVGLLAKFVVLFLICANKLIQLRGSENSFGRAKA